MAGFAGVVLAGGRSSRMGVPKSGLEWHRSTLLRRTVGIVSRATGGPVVVVRARGQSLPPLPVGTVVVDDQREGKGPVQGIAAGLAALDGQAETAFVASTDLPFLHPAFIACVLRALSAEGADVALPVAGGYRQPLAAAYRVSLAETAQRLVGAGRLRPAFLFDECVVLRLDEAQLRRDPVLAAFDPELDSVRNVNSPADYRAARSLPAPEVTVAVAGPLISASRRAGPRTVRAATARRAAEAVGLPPNRPAVTTINGDPVATDGETPLATGDVVVFSLVSRRTLSRRELVEGRYFVGAHGTTARGAADGWDRRPAKFHEPGRSAGRRGAARHPGGRRGAHPDDADPGG